MRKPALAAVIAAATVLIPLAFAPAASATPSRTTPCSNCHSGVNVPITTSLVSVTATQASYTVNAPAGDAIAVFDGTTRVAIISASSGSFKVAPGKSYTVYAVNGPSTSSGIGSTVVSPVAPVVDTTPPSTTSNAATSYTGTASITLTAADNAGGTGVAHTYWRLDGAAPVEGHLVVVPALGSHTLEFWSVDVAGNIEVHKNVAFTVAAPPVPNTYVPVAGATRYETAVQASVQAFPGGASCVVIATGANWPDALGGGALAAAKGGPILLTDANTLPGAVTAEIARLGATEAVVLGGPGAVGPGVEGALRLLLGDANVTRIGGSNRYETATMIAEETVAELTANGGYDGVAFLATGANFPDALAAAPLSAAKGWPLFLVGPNGVSAETQASMGSCGVTDVLILGGTGAVAGAVESGLVVTYGDANVTRLSGTNRYHTAVVVAAYGVTDAGLSWDGVALATGGNFPDALAGGVMQGRAGSVMLLTTPTSLQADTKACLVANKGVIDTVKYLGGTGAVSTGVRSEVNAALQ